MAGVVCSGYAQQDLPIEIRNFLENYVKDSTAKWGPLKYKRRGTIPDSIQIKDLRLRALQIYRFKDIYLNEYPDTIALDEVIEPDILWRVLVMAHNKPLYELMLNNKTGEPRITEATFPTPIGSELRSNIWGPLLKAYPESTGINPILIGSSKNHSFLYFKQKGPRKIYYCNRRDGKKHDSLDSLFTASIETLDDSRKLINWKKREIYVNERMRRENTNAIDIDESIEPKEGSFSAFIDGPRNFKENGLNESFPTGGNQ